MIIENIRFRVGFRSKSRNKKLVVLGIRESPESFRIGVDSGTEKGFGSFKHVVHGHAVFLLEDESEFGGFGFPVESDGVDDVSPELSREELVKHCTEEHD